MLFSAVLFLSSWSLEFRIQTDSQNRILHINSIPNFYPTFTTWISLGSYRRSIQKRPAGLGSWKGLALVQTRWFWGWNPMISMGICHGFMMISIGESMMIYWWFIDLDHGKFFGIPIYRFTIKMLSYYGILLQLHSDLSGLLMILWDINDSNNN